jgi:hypothetical protein
MLTGYMILSITTFRITAFSIKGLNVTLSIADTLHNNALDFAECCFPECCSLITFMRNVFMLNVLMLIVIAPY